ncbi:hypothetical protein OWV82_006688 [Melia azedarach]|uniref:Uncharacterized protein n=1 Tax=Melia azedarach TaxID=155640 RepID=A0ACC1YJI0_MELAZ|nr:hypothetical protein OWV82_006688 [Melia azedarach]
MASKQTAKSSASGKGFKSNLQALLDQLKIAKGKSPLGKSSKNSPSDQTKKLSPKSSKTMPAPKDKGRIWPWALPKRHVDWVEEEEDSVDSNPLKRRKRSASKSEKSYYDCSLRIYLSTKKKDFGHLTLTISKLGTFIYPVIDDVVS